MNRAPELKVDRSVTKALRLVGADRLRWLDEAAALGPVVALRIGPLTAWVISDPEVARNMLVTERDCWVRPPTLRTPLRVAVGENLFNQDDRAWAQLQPSVAPAFRKTALEPRLADVGALIDDEVGALPVDTTIDLELAMGRMALIVAAWVLLGAHLDRGRAEEFTYHQREVVRWVGDRVGKLSGISPVVVGASGKEMKRHRAALNAYVDEVISRATADERGHDDVLGALLRARPSGRALAPDQLRTHVLGLFLAGNETTAAALSWALVHGARQPDEWLSLRSDPDRHTVPFINETLRLTPPVWGLPRTPTKAGVTVTAGGFTTRVRRGQVATVYLRGVNRDPATWEDPLRFDPSRHRSKLTDHHALLAFGLGPRGCIGQHLAVAEMAAVLPALARHGNVAVDEPADEEPTLSLHVRGGLTGRFTPITEWARRS